MTSSSESTDTRPAVVQRPVSSDEAGMRLDRWFKLHYPGIGFGQLQKLLRSGQIRVDGSRAKTNLRLASGQTVRVPPVEADAKAAPQTVNTIRDRHDRDVLQEAMLYEDDVVMVINKPAGLAVQGGSGLNRHVDGMLEAFRDSKGRKPRLIHRLDRETTGVLVIAKTRGAAAELSVAFRSRRANKVYWALLWGLPKPLQGRISTYLARGEGDASDRMTVARHGEDDAQHAVSLYSVVEHAGQKLAWTALKPITGRTHQLRAHAAHIGHPIIGDPKYFNVENWDLPAGIQNRLHLLARRIVLPHPDGGTIDVTAPLPQHMHQSWAQLGFELLDDGDQDGDVFAKLERKQRR
ncbi:MAG: RluA family pseudouridine synthase [Pseudomonadota bacterium]